MGDRRYEPAYRAVAEAKDPVQAMAALDDEEVVQALAAASRKMDAYLANVLAVEALKRQRLHRARMWGAVVGLGSAVVLRAILLLPRERELALLSVAALVPAAILGYATYRVVLARGSR